MLNVAYAARGYIVINGVPYFNPEGCKNTADIFGGLVIDNHLNTKVKVYDQLDCKGTIVATVGVDKYLKLGLHVGLSIMVD
ncbi:unnamed protein product [Cunninghamella echinulata]